MKIPSKQQLWRAFHSPTVLMLSLGAVSMTAYQNCGANMSFTAEQQSLEQFYSTSAVTINNGAAYTTDTSVNVQFKFAGQIQDMYLTNDPTCETGGEWQPSVSERPWILGQKNQKASVYVKFRPKGGAALPCISASIVHDDVAPSVGISKGPGAYSRNLVEDVGFTGDDSGSGFDKFECRFTGQTAYKDCAALEKLSIVATTSTSVNLQVRSVDKAGNRSALLERNWLLDRTPPVVAIVEKPSSVSALNFASFRMEVTEETNGSGVDTIYCQLDSTTVKVGCNLTEVAQNLSEGAHLFQVWATDKAGNESAKAQAMWTVTTPPAGSFQIIGLTSSPGTEVVAGSVDTEINGILGTSLVPQVTFSASSGAATYDVSILNQAGTATVCGPMNTMSTTYAFTKATCTLTDAGRYQAKVVAYTAQNKIATNTGNFPFYVDATGPVFTVNPAVVANDQKSATITFAMSDAGSGLRDATCTRTYKTTTQTFACKDLTTYKFENLADGEHIFTITATDNAQNTRTSTPVSWQSKLIICDPFSNIEGGCKRGLKGNIYYLTGEQLKAPFGAVDDYINKGKLANAILYLSQVFVPTRNFSSGFTGDEDVAINDDSGAKLVEYFALDMQTLVKLGPKDAAGRYQFALISDDGSVLQTKDASGRWNDLVNDDGTHSTRMGCDKVGVVLDATSRVPMRLKYYQGPRTEIAVTLMWRYRTSKQSLDEDICGSEGTNDFFGPNFNDMTNTYKFGKLIDNGWKVLTSDNFVLDESK